MNLDAKVNNQIKRNDFAIIIAVNRQLATILPVRLEQTASDRLAGLVLGRVTATGFYTEYNDSNSDGSEVAAAILFEDVLVEDISSASPSGSASGTAIARGVFGGEVFQDKLTGLDAAAKVDLGARTIIDASGVSILKF